MKPRILNFGLLNPKESTTAINVRTEDWAEDC